MENEVSIEKEGPKRAHRSDIIIWYIANQVVDIG